MKPMPLGEFAGAIIDGLRQGDWVPRSVREKAKKIEEAYQHLEQQYLRSVSDAEISSYLEVSEKEFVPCFRRSR